MQHHHPKYVLGNIRVDSKLKTCIMEKKLNKDSNLFIDLALLLLFLSLFYLGQKKIYLPIRQDQIHLWFNSAGFKTKTESVFWLPEDDREWAWVKCRIQFYLHTLNIQNQWEYLVFNKQIENTLVSTYKGDLVCWTHRYPAPTLSFCVVLHPPAGNSSQVLQRLVNWCGYQNLLFANFAAEPWGPQ